MSLSRRSVLAAAPAFAAGPAQPRQRAPSTAAAADALPTPQEVSDLARRARQAHAALMLGDVDGYRGFITTTPDFLLMAPFGGEPTHGSDLSEDRWNAMKRFFRHGRDATLELVQAWCAPNMVVLAVIERAQVEVGGLPGQDWSLRVTLVFRRDEGRWLLAHRHADPLAHGIGLEEAAGIARRRGAA